MPRRKEYRQMVRDLADCIDTIIMYAGDPLPPSTMRVFNITPEIYEWMQGYSTKAHGFLDWRSKMYPAQPASLPDGVTYADAIRGVDGDVGEDQERLHGEVPPARPHP